MKQPKYLDLVRSIAPKWAVDPALVLAIIRQESNFTATAHNGTGGDALRGGAYGLMQMTYKTAVGLGYKEANGDSLFVPATNLTYGCKLISQLQKRRGYTVRDVVCAYNSGKPEARAPASTLVYVERVMRFYAEYSEMLRSLDPEILALG